MVNQSQINETSIFIAIKLINAEIQGAIYLQTEQDVDLDNASLSIRQSKKASEIAGRIDAARDAFLCLYPNLCIDLHGCYLKAAKICKSIIEQDPGVEDELNVVIHLIKDAETHTKTWETVALSRYKNYKSILKKIQKA